MKVFPRASATSLSLPHIRNTHCLYSSVVILKLWEVTHWPCQTRRDTGRSPPTHRRNVRLDLLFEGVEGVWASSKRGSNHIGMTTYLFLLNCCALVKFRQHWATLLLTMQCMVHMSLSLLSILALALWAGKGILCLNQKCFRVSHMLFE